MNDADLEDRIRTALRRDLARAPGPEFTVRVMDALPEARDTGGRERLATLGLAVLSVVIAIGAIRAALAWMAAPLPGPSAAASVTGESHAPTAPQNATMPPDLAMEQLWELVVPRLPGWLVRINGTHDNFSGQDIYGVGSMGTVPVFETCESGDPWSCLTAWDPSAEIQVRFEHLFSVRRAWSQWGMVSRAAPAGAERITIDGVGAQVRVVDGETVPDTNEIVRGAARIIVWDLPSPGSLWASYRITAVIRGDAARADALEGQASDVVDGIRYSPPFAWDLPEDDPEGALETGLRALREQASRSDTMDASCFPNEPGGRRDALIEKAAFLPYELTRPLEVTCSSAIEPTEFRRWKMTLRYDWQATDEYDAGHAELVVLLDRMYGDVGYGGDYFGVDEMPYLRRL
jgi:hypothetical protein